MTDDELKALVASLAVDSKNLHEAQKATDEQMKRTDEQMKHNDNRLTEKPDRMGITLGNIGQNQGDVVEAKYKAHENDLDKLDRKMKHFKQLFPIYRNYKQYGAIASFHINDDAKKEALRRGYFVLQRSGDLVHTETSDHLAVL